MKFSAIILVFFFTISQVHAFGSARHEETQNALLPFQITATLQTEIPKAQSRLENHLRDFGTVVNVNPNGEITGDDDSALWTGVYLASQCFQYSVETSQTRKTAVYDRIESTYAAIERLFAVTQVPGLMARFAFDPLTAAAKSSKHLSAIIPGTEPFHTAGWRKSKNPNYKDWTWFGATSRDQYSGFFFAMGICTKYLEPTSPLRAKMKAHVISTVSEIKKNSWKIPAGDHNYGKQTLHIIDGDLKIAWARLAQSLTPDKKVKDVFTKDIQSELTKLQLRVAAEQKDIPVLGVTPPEFNNYVEYYGWNLRYLAYYLIFMVPDQDVKIQSAAKDYLLKNMWRHTGEHLNSMFTFIKLASVGVTDLTKDQKSLNEAGTSLEELALKDRSDKEMKNSPRLGNDLELDPRAKKIKDGIDIVKKTPFLNDWIKKQTGLDILEYSKKFNPNVSKTPLPIKERPPGDFYWQLNPRVLDGGSNLGLEYPGVDLILGYWMGVTHGYLER